MNIKFKLITIFSAFLIPICASAYEPLKDYEFVSTKHSTSIGGFTVDYTLNTHSQDYSQEWMLYNLHAASEKLVRYAKQSNYKTLECRPVSNIDIYIVKDDILNNRNLFSKYNVGNSTHEILGLFDKRFNEPDKVSIVISESHKYDSSVITHELFHYWAYRFCWDFYYPDTNNEPVALEFETYDMWSK